MFDVLTLWLIIWIVKNAVMDVSCAVTGKPNPRYELKKAKAKAAGQAAPALPRYGTRDWFDDLVADGLQAQTEWRRRKAADKRAKRERAQEQVEREREQAEQDGDEQPAAPQPAEPTQPAQTPSRWGWTCRHEGCPGKGFDFDSQQAASDGAREHLQRVHGGAPGPGAEVLRTEALAPAAPSSVVHDGDRTYVPGGPAAGGGQGAPEGRRGTCRRCGAGFVVRTDSSAALCDDCAIAFSKAAVELLGQAVAGARQPEPAPQTSAPGPGGAPGTEQQQPPRPIPQPADGPDAKVIPFRIPNPIQEESVTTDIHTEVQGLDQSIAYAHSLATFAGEHGQAGNEGYIAHLTGQKVEGDALRTAAEMQEAFTNAQSAAEAHAAELEKQKQVQEAYDNNPDAGDKDYQTQGR